MHFFYKYLKINRRIFCILAQFGVFQVKIDDFWIEKEVHCARTRNNNKERARMRI